MKAGLVYRASELLNDPRFRQIAMRHADTAGKAFVRADGSVCHIVAFDPNTGARLCSYGGQGLGHGSSWTRGQAWALYGFTLSQLHAGERSYLQTAIKIADRFVERIPDSSLIPIDFDQPKEIGLADSTAAAIAACGLKEPHASPKEWAAWGKGGRMLRKRNGAAFFQRGAANRSRTGTVSLPADFK